MVRERARETAATPQRTGTPATSRSDCAGARAVGRLRDLVGPADGATGVADDGVDAQIWAEEGVRQVARVREAREKDRQDLRAAEWGEKWSPTDDDVHRNSRAVWAAQHQLIWASCQFERWKCRLAIERGEAEPPVDPVLANLRNALEHLDDAEFNDDFYAAAGLVKWNRGLG